MGFRRGLNDGRINDFIPIANNDVRSTDTSVNVNVGGVGILFYIGIICHRFPSWEE